jgi:hypothetical protein
LTTSPDRVTTTPYCTEGEQGMEPRQGIFPADVYIVAGELYGIMDALDEVIKHITDPRSEIAQEFSEVSNRFGEHSIAFKESMDCLSKGVLKTTFPALAKNAKQTRQQAEKLLARVVKYH